MSIIKSIKQVLGLGPAAENHFWDGSVPNQLSLKRGTPDAPGAELIKALNGVLSFPNQGQSLTGNGYVKLPGGLIVQWGTVPPSPGFKDVNFQIDFPNTVFSVTATPLLGSTPGNTALLSTYVGTQGVTGFSCAVMFYNGTTLDFANEGFNWIAIGH